MKNKIFAIQKLANDVRRGNLHENKKENILVLVTAKESKKIHGTGKRCRKAGNGDLYILHASAGRKIYWKVEENVRNAEGWQIMDAGWAGRSACAVNRTCEPTSATCQRKRHHRGSAGAAGEKEKISLERIAGADCSTSARRAPACFPKESGCHWRYDRKTQDA